MSKTPHWRQFTSIFPIRGRSVAIVADDTIVARHDRLSNAGETRYDWQHYIPLLQRKPGALRNGAPFADMPEPLQRLRRGLLRNPGGDRVMAQVLAIVLSAGLDAMLVAIELALESGPPGKVSVEHVVNVLNRLNAQPVPPTAATLLRATTPPLATFKAPPSPALRPGSPCRLLSAPVVGEDLLAQRILAIVKQLEDPICVASSCRIDVSLIGSRASLLCDASSDVDILCCFRGGAHVGKECQDVSLHIAFGVVGKMLLDVCASNQLQSVTLQWGRSTRQCRWPNNKVGAREEGGGEGLA